MTTLSPPTADAPVHAEAEIPVTEWVWTKEAAHRSGIKAVSFLRVARRAGLRFEKIKWGTRYHLVWHPRDLQAWIERRRLPRPKVRPGMDPTPLADNLPPLMREILTLMREHPEMSILAISRQAGVSYQLYRTWALGAGMTMKTADAVVEAMGYRLIVVPAGKADEIVRLKAEVKRLQKEGGR